MDINGFKNTYEHKKVVENNNKVTQHPTASVCVQTYLHLIKLRNVLRKLRLNFLNQINQNFHIS